MRGFRLRGPGIAGKLKTALLLKGIYRGKGSYFHTRDKHDPQCERVCVCACQMLFREGLQRKHISGNYDCHWRSPSMLLAALMERGRTRSPTPVTHCALRILARSVICTMFAYDFVCVCVRQREWSENIWAGYLHRVIINSTLAFLRSHGNVVIVPKE